MLLKRLALALELLPLELDRKLPPMLFPSHLCLCLVNALFINRLCKLSMPSFTGFGSLALSGGSLPLSIDIEAGPGMELYMLLLVLLLFPSWLLLLAIEP